MSELAILNRPLVPQTQEPPRSTMDMVAEAVSRGASVEVLEKLMGLHERWEAAQARRAFDAAMAAAKSEIKPISKNRHVGFDSRDPNKGRTDYDYEDLAEISRSVDPILAKHGLSWRHRTEQTDKIKVTCIIAHKDGYFEENSLFASADTSGNKNSIQAIGSTVTFLQRYTLKAALGLAASKDDDGQAASGDEVISDAQADEIIALADEVGANKVSFCKYMKVDAIALIKAKDFSRAKKELERKRGSK